MIFPRSWSRTREWEHLCPGLCSGCGSDHSLGGDSWSHRVQWRLWPAEEGASGRCPRTQGTQSRQGEREGTEASAPRGHASPSTVCVKGWGRPWSPSRWVWGPQFPLSRTLDRKRLPSLCLWRQACLGISQLLPQSVCFGVRADVTVNSVADLRSAFLFTLGF